MANEDQFMQKLEELMKDDPETKSIFDSIVSAIGTNGDEPVEVEAIEIDGINYFIAREFIIKGTTYFHLVNENDPLDFMFRKLQIENGEEYLVTLESKQEFDLVFAYDQKYILRDIKRAQELNPGSQNE